MPDTTFLKPHEPRVGLVSLRFVRVFAVNVVLFQLGEFSSFDLHQECPFQIFYEFYNILKGLKTSTRKPHTLNPKPYTRHPTPDTLNPNLRSRPEREVLLRRFHLGGVGIGFEDRRG